jgi:hypothetical protein
MAQHGVQIDGATLVRILDHESSNVSEVAANTYDHVAVGTVSTTGRLYVNGLTYGNDVRGGTTKARNVITPGAFIATPVRIESVIGNQLVVNGRIIDDSNLVNVSGIFLSHVQDENVIGLATAQHEAVAWRALTLTVFAATPSVQSFHTIVFNFGAGTVTDFLSGVENQEIVVVNLNAASTTLQHAGGGNLRNKSGANITLAQNQATRYTKKGSLWIEG